MIGRTYHRRYGYRWREAIPAELWWRVEHLGFYRGADGGLFGMIRRLGYRRRKHWERLGAAQRLSSQVAREVVMRSDSSTIWALPPVLKRDRREP